MSRKFLIRQKFAQFILKITGWKTTGETPPNGILVGAPHTSNWDWPISLLLFWSSGIQPTVLAKKELFVPPLSWLLKATGAVPLDRDNPRRTVEDLIAQARAAEGPFHLGITAEGTRSKGTYWKSGFRRIAIETGLPILTVYLDAPSKTTGWGPVFYPSDDVRADMDILRDFFGDKRGFKPENATIPLLREESEEVNGTSENGTAQ